MEQWGFVVAAFGLTGIILAGYVLVLRGRLRAAEAELNDLRLRGRAGEGLEGAVTSQDSDQRR